MDSGLGLQLAEAGEMLRSGRTVAFPTETVYGLGADATNTEAVRGIYKAKGRPSDNPLIVHIADRSQLKGLVAEPIAEPLERLMDCYWPGPLTLILPVCPDRISPLVTAGLSTVGVRIPDHPIARELIRVAGCPVAAPSANSSGRPSPTSAAHVREDLDGRIGGIVDGGPAGVGVESTVVEWSQGALHILRPGGVTIEQLREALPGTRVLVVESPAEGAEPLAPDPDMDADQDTDSAATAMADTKVEATEAASNAGAAAIEDGNARPVTIEDGSARAATNGASNGGAASGEPEAGVADSTGSAGSTSHAAEHSPAPRAPGMKYRHYAPRGRMWLMVGGEADPAAAAQAARRELRAAKARGERTGVLTFAERSALYEEADLVVVCGRLSEPQTIAQGLFAALRRFDQDDVTYILAESCPEQGIGAAVMNRLRKAAGGRILQVDAGSTGR